MTDDFRRVIERAAGALKDFGAREVYLFGSAARGLSRPHGDVDIAVAGLPPRVFFRAMTKASDALKCPIDLIDLDDDTPFSRLLREKGDLIRVG